MLTYLHLHQLLFSLSVALWLVIPFLLIIVLTVRVAYSRGFADAYLEYCDSLKTLTIASEQRKIEADALHRDYLFHRKLLELSRDQWKEAAFSWQRAFNKRKVNDKPS